MLKIMALNLGNYGPISGRFIAVILMIVIFTKLRKNYTYKLRKNYGKITLTERALVVLMQFICINATGHLKQGMQ